MRISQVAGHYLIFDPSAASVLRREANTNGVLVGTCPQQPSQNIFLGLPIELRKEEVDVLVNQGIAHVVDAAAAHAEILSNPTAVQGYVAALEKQKQIAAKGLDEHDALRAEESRKRSRGAFAGEVVPTQKRELGVTPTHSDGIFARVPAAPESRGTASLCGLLQSRGCHMTPGLRFGARYSVYPGDPLRFHAHFMANEYSWHEEIPVLDIVSGGRLATAVKKAFLIGGPEDVDGTLTGQVKSFSIEWASM